MDINLVCVREDINDPNFPSCTLIYSQETPLSLRIFLGPGRKSKLYGLVKTFPPRERINRVYSDFPITLGLYEKQSKKTAPSEDFNSPL